MRSKVESSEKVVVSKLNIVDLAGSERTKKTGKNQNFIIHKLKLFKKIIKIIKKNYQNYLKFFLIFKGSAG
jgi:kinesin family protein 6/9